MTTPAARFVFDFVDPLSYLVHRALAELAAAHAPAVEAVGIEMRPAPAPLTDAADPFWSARWDEAARASPHVPLARPALVPWSLKAHELHALAADKGVGPLVLRGVFDAFMLQGRDIGRIDVLLDVAGAAGLDRTETKAALDVDRWQEPVAEAGRLARSFGVREPPAILIAGRLVQGFHNLTDLGTLLGGSP